MRAGILLASCSLLLAAITFPTHAEHTPPGLRSLVVFDFASSWDGGKRGRKVAGMFRGHAARRGTFTVPDPISFEEALEASGAVVTLDSSAAEVSAITRDFFDAEVAIWGEVTRVDADTYRLHVRAVDRSKAPAALALDRVYTSTKHGLQVSVEKALNDVGGSAAPVPKDRLADVSWRKRRNLCVNGDFERGNSSPAAWERVDGLCTFWVEGVSPTGRCVMIDTDVLASQYKGWRQAFEAGAPASQAPKRLPTRPPYYDTVGGTVGAHLYSEPIPIRQGPAYRIDLDMRGRSGEVKCFVKGYASFGGHDGAVEQREVYRAQINLTRSAAGFVESLSRPEWDHYAMIFHPTQPLHLMLIHSDFDNGKTGSRLRQLLIRRLNALGAVEVKDAEMILQRLKGCEDRIRVATPEREIFFVIRERLGRGACVWGEVFQDGRKLRIVLRGMDVRTGGTGGSVTKVWRKSWDVAPGRLARTVPELADTIVEKARVVTRLRIKLDVYWPVGKRYFDNVRLTEEPQEQ